MTLYSVTLERIVDADDADEAVEIAIEEINGRGGLEALDFDVAELVPE